MPLTLPPGTRLVAATHNAGKAREFAAMLGDAGLHGLEADHPDHDQAARERVRALAKSLNMVATGSSDYHGSRKTVTLGQCTTDPDAFAALLPEYA